MRFATLLWLVAACGAKPAVTGQPPRDLDVATRAEVDAATPSAPPVTAEPVTTATPPAPPAPVEDLPPDPATLERLAWPATTTSFVLRRPAHAVAEPDPNAEPLGKIIDGTRYPVRASAAGNKRCKVWLAVAPKGWICARDAKPSTLPPEAVVQPVMPAGAILPNEYYDVKDGAARFETEDDVRAGNPLPEPKDKSTYMVTKDEVVDIDGERYVKTVVGFVAMSDLRRHKPSTFAGIDLVATPPPAWPFAWVIAVKDKPVIARAAADRKAAEAGTFEHRAIVPVLEEVSGFVRVGESKWISRKSVRIARKRTRPAIDAAPSKWIDLDRDEQVMIAYDGDKPVFATLFSSGIRKKDTPPALYRIRSKSSVTKMTAEERESTYYAVSEVPWATRFRSGLYFHAAYWHDRFGDPRSHGCVNLSPRDAKWVYDWTEPRMPAGWNELEVAMGDAMIVRVHDAKKPDPPVFDYVREAKERAKIRKRELELKKKREEAEAAADAAAESGIVPMPATPN
jgi:lipoprotein-anchoring transpeptidase ErfK/SrfK